MKPPSLNHDALWCWTTELTEDEALEAFGLLLARFNPLVVARASRRETGDAVAEPAAPDAEILERWFNLGASDQGGAR